jgi:hypothetical protein
MRNILGALISASLLTAGVATAMSAEKSAQKMWEFAVGSGSVEVLETFLKSYPDSEHAEEARELVRGMQHDSELRKLEKRIFALSGAVTYDAPLPFVNDRISGHSIETITSISPQFPPIEGLPEEAWKTKECTACHQWTRVSLCTQSQTYVEKETEKYMRKQHPFGGILKINLRNWAENGCQ